MAFCQATNMPSGLCANQKCPALQNRRGGVKETGGGEAVEPSSNGRPQTRRPARRRVPGPSLGRRCQPLIPSCLFYKPRRERSLDEQINIVSPELCPRNYPVLCPRNSAGIRNFYPHTLYCNLNNLIVRNSNCDFSTCSDEIFCKLILKLSPSSVNNKVSGYKFWNSITNSKANLSEASMVITSWSLLILTIAPSSDP